MVYADLNGWRVNGGTVPHEKALTEQKLDLVIIDKAAVQCQDPAGGADRPLGFFPELGTAVERRTARYERLIEDLREAGFNTRNMALEIGCRGVINLRNAANLEYICNLVEMRAILTRPNQRSLKFICDSHSTIQMLDGIIFCN